MDVTVLKNGKAVFARAYGMADGITGEAATSDHVYHYWSMTKSYTAVAIFQLIEKGKVSLDAPLTSYLPQFVPIDQSGDPVEVTIDHLLRHSSGLSDFSMEMLKWLHATDEPRFGETRMVNERLGDYRTVNWTPGSQSQYGNINYVLLGAIIEAVTGGTYEDYVRQEILLPLKMRATDFVYREDMLEKAVVGSQTHYSFYTLMVELMGPAGGLDGITKRQIGDRHWLNYVYTDYAASTALIGTGADMSRFGQMLLNLGELDGVRILSEDSAEKILHGGRLPGYIEEVTEGKRKLALGYGTKTWVDQGVELMGHGGGGPGYALQYFVVPEKELVVVVLTNSSMAKADELSKLVASVF
jgi:CubicO group peptidase (beta-lactamase class C family)